MPDWWSAEVWTVIITALIGVPTVTVSVIALVKSSTARRHANEANEIAREALKVQERQVEVVVSSEQRNRSADLRISRSVMLMQNGQRAKLQIENRGAHDAEDIALMLHHGDDVLDFGSVPRLRTDERAAILQYMGRFFQRLDDPSEVEFELRAAYRDGNGEQAARWGVTIAPGKQFVNRRWTIQKIANSPSQE